MFLAQIADIAAGARVSGAIRSRHRADGTEILVRVANAPVTGADGKVSILGIAEDVTREHEAQRLVAEILERIDDGFVAFDRDWRYTYVNERAGALLGRRPEDLVGRIYQEEFPEAVGTPFQVAYAEAMERQVAIVIEEHYAPWDRWFQNRIYPSGDGIAVLFTEVTDRKRAEQALRESEHRVRTALENLPLLGVILDTGGRITLINDALLDLTSWAREDVVGKEWFELFIPPEIRAEMRQRRFDASIAAGEIAIHLENEIVTRAGERRLVAWNNTILRDADGRVTGTASLGEDITERRRTERALIEAKEALERAEEQGGLGSWRLDVATGHRSWSRQMYRLYSLDPAAGVPDPQQFLASIHPDDRATMDAAYRALVAGVDPETAIIRTNPASGPVRFLIPSWQLVRDDSGRPIRYEGTLLDVTERERAERELRAVTEVLRRTGHLAKVGGWTLQVPSMDLTWTEEIDRIHEDVAAGQPTLELALSFYPPESRSLLEAAIEASITSAVPWDLELAVVTISGRRIWVRSIARPVVEDGIVVRIEGATQDITERKTAQEEARVRLDRLTAATEAAGLGVFDWNLATDESYATPGYFATLGHEPEPGTPEPGTPEPGTPDTGTPEPGTWLERLHPDDQAAVATMFREAMAGSNALFSYEARVRRSEGPYRWVRIAGRAIGRSEEGQQRRILGILDDITDRVELEVRLRQAEKMETLCRFAGILAHDLRNYLNAIGWSVGLLASEIDEADSRRPDVDHIQAAVNGGLGMVRNVLDFARPDARDRGVTDLREHLVQVGGIVGRLVGTAVTFETDLPEDLPRVAISPAAVTQILLNLAANARDAMPDGGLFRISATVRTVTLDDADDAPGHDLLPGRYVQIRVSDTGEGMDLATAHRAFDAFYTTKDEGGTGLGLSSVYLIVTRAGGSEAVASNPGAGTTLTIDLPVAD